MDILTFVLLLAAVVLRPIGVLMAPVAPVLVAAFLGVALLLKAVLLVITIPTFEISFRFLAVFLDVFVPFVAFVAARRWH